MGKIWVEAEKVQSQRFGELLAVLTVADVPLRRQLVKQYGEHNIEMTGPALKRVGFPQQFIDELGKGYAVRFQMNQEGFEHILKGQVSRGSRYFGELSATSSAPNDFETFFDAYIETALWSSTDDDGDPLDDNYSEIDIDKKTLKMLRAEARDFFKANKKLLAERGAAQGGHDFWLTRNGHGAGFWDGDWPQNGDELTRASKAYGSVDLLVGVEGKIYA